MDTKKHLLTLEKDLSEFMVPAVNHYSSTIYHYTSPKVVEDILLENGVRLRFTRSDCMNDVSEGYYADELYQLAIRSLFETSEITKKYRAFLLEIYTRAAKYYNDGFGDELYRSAYRLQCIGNSYYLCCFSTSWDALALWNYYVKDKRYEGFCIGCNAGLIEKAKYLDKGYAVHVCSVKYDKFFEECNDLIKKYRGFFRYSDDQGKASLSFMICCFLEKYRLVVKNNCFSHEQEVRAILNIKSKSSITEKFDWSKGFPRPFIEIDFDKSVFSDIVIGPLVEKDISKKMTEEFLASRSYPHNRVRNSKAPIRF